MKYMALNQVQDDLTIPNHEEEVQLDKCENDLENHSSVEYSYMSLSTNSHLDMDTDETNSISDTDSITESIRSDTLYDNDRCSLLYFIIPFDFLLFTLTYLGLFIEYSNRGILYYFLWTTTFINNLIIYWTTTQYPIFEYSIEDIVAISGFIWRYLFIIYITIVEINSIHSIIFQWVFTTMNGWFMYEYYKIRKDCFEVERSNGFSKFYNNTV